MKTTTPAQPTAAHTPTPWTDDGSEILAWIPCEGGQRREIVAKFSAAPNKANAAFIVRAVNSHAQLVAALEAAEFVIGECAVGRDKLSDLFPRKLEAIRAALAAAKS